MLNELTPAMGITFNQDKTSQAPMAPAPDSSPELTRGVKAIGSWGACSLTLSGTARAQYFFDQAHGGRPFVASATFGDGRVIAIGDSSPFDDGTGAHGHKLYNAYNNKEYTIPPFALNAVDYLARKPPTAP